MGALVAAWVILVLVAAWNLLPSPVPYVPPVGVVRFAPAIAVQDMISDGSLVLVAGIGGLSEIDANGSERPVDLAGVSGLGSPPMLRALLSDGQGRLWLGHQNGLAIRVGQSWHDVARADGSALGTVRVLVTDASGVVWGGGARGLFRVGEGISPVPVAFPQPDAEVTAMTFDRAGGLWVGTVTHGVFRLHDGTWTDWTVADGLPHPQVTALLVTAEGSVWCGSGFYNKGGAALFRADPSGQWRLSETLGVSNLAGPKVRSLFEDADGRLWLGHEYDGITIRQGNATVRFLTEADGLPDSEVTLFRQATGGGLWIGTMKGLLRLSPAAVETLFLHEADNSHES